MEQDGASVYGRYPDSGYTSEPSRSLGHSQALRDDTCDLQRRPRGATRRTRSSLNAVADQLTEQLVETADALVNPAAARQPTRTRGTRRGVKTSVIQPVPRPSERRTTPPSAPFERESRPLPAHSSGPSTVRSLTSAMPDWSEGDDASGNDDMDEAPVRLTQIVSPRTGKTRTIVRKPAAELATTTTTSVSTSVGELQLPSFMLSNQSSNARPQQTYSPPPEWLAAALSGNTNANQSAPTRPAALDSFPVSRPARLDSANGPLGSLIDANNDNNNNNNSFAHYDAFSNSPSYKYDIFAATPEPAQLYDRSPPSPLPFSLPGHMPHQHASSSPSLTSMSRFTPPTSVTPLYEAQMLRAPHAYAFAEEEEGVFSPLPLESDPWLAQQPSGHLFLDDSFIGGGDDDDRHVRHDPNLSDWGDPELASLDEGQPSTSRAWQQPRRPSINYPRSDNETAPIALAAGQYPALPLQNMQDSMSQQSLPSPSRRQTPPPNPQQMVQELARARRVAKLEEAAAEVVGPMSPLLFVRSLDHHLPPLAAPLATPAEEEDRFSPLPLPPPPPPPRQFPSPSASERNPANGAALTYERRHYQTPEARLPSFFSSFATQQPHHAAAAAVPISRPLSTSWYLAESGGMSLPAADFPIGRNEGEEDVRTHGEDAFTVHEPADEDSTLTEDSGADRTVVDPPAEPAPPNRNDPPFTIYEDSD